jgi:hypothetical protein
MHSVSGEAVSRCQHANGDVHIGIGVPVDTVSFLHDGATPLLLAARQGHVVAVEMLLKAKVRGKGSWGTGLLNLAPATSPNLSPPLRM